MRVNVYIDGFNLYYGALKGTPYRWLNVAEFTRHVLRPLLPSFSLWHVRYFTALAKDDEAHGTLDRQLIYLRALRTLPNLTIHMGQYKRRKVTARLVQPLDDGTASVTVWKTEEKGSDVNLASYLLLDAAAGCFDVAVIVSNDTDLIEPITLVRAQFARAVILIAPTYLERRYMNAEIASACDIAIPMRKTEHKAILRASQFAPAILDGDGIVERPARWAP